MLLMVEKGIRGGILHTIHRYAKANNKYLKNYDRNKESLYLKYRDGDNIYGWAIPQQLPINGFKWVKDLSEFYEGSVRSSDEKVDIQYPENLHNVQNDLRVLSERKHRKS